MRFDEMVAALALEDSADILRPGWEESARSFPQDEIAFLTEPFLRQAVTPFATHPDGVRAAIAMGRRIADDVALRSFAWHYHCVIHDPRTAAWDRIHKWPSLEHALEQEAGLFNAVVFLSGVRTMQEIHSARKIPRDVIDTTLDDVSIGLCRAGGDSHIGMSPDDVAWFAGFTRGELYRLGRLQFQLDWFVPHFRAYRHRETRSLLALAETGGQFRTDGQLSLTEDEPGHWHARLEVTETSITGCPILPEGRAVDRPVTLSAAEWELEASSRDRALAVHIPGDGPGGERLDIDACGDSFRRALEFFPAYYPDFSFVGFCCESWLLNSWLEQVLPPSSNIVRFQREVYLLPGELDRHEIVDAAFDGRLPEDLSQAPRETSFQRAVLAMLEKGDEVPSTAGKCFLLSKDVVRWGTQCYRTQALPIVA